MVTPACGAPAALTRCATSAINSSCVVALTYCQLPALAPETSGGA